MYLAGAIFRDFMFSNYLYDKIPHTYMQKIFTNLKFTNGSILELVVLKMLSGKTYSATEIRDTLKMFSLKTPMGSLYPLLTKFRRNNYVKSGYEEGDSGFGIKTYDLTEKGHQRLRDLQKDWNQLNRLIASIGSR